MPIVVVTYGPAVSSAQLTLLAESLPHAVSVAVACAEEPYDHELQPGDVEIRFSRLGPHDISGLDVVVEVRSKWFQSRAQNRHERCQRLRDVIHEATGIPRIGVYLVLPVAGWAQSD